MYFDEKRDSTLIWNEALKPEQKYVLRQVSDSLMMLQLPDQNEKMVFRKMLPFTTFLIRFRYDYLHGGQSGNTTTEYEEEIAVASFHLLHSA
ncbi:MAG: hypothetical protein ICV79_19150 [Flavisolibacter sp.]|nr:hypothetical protein [Flavisolibacter sp.]